MSEKQNRIIKECFELQINSPGESPKVSFTLDKNVKIIFGLSLSSDRDDMLYYRGKQAIYINGEEFFPANFESKYLMHGMQIPGAERMYRIGEVEPGNRQVDLHYTDHANDDMIAFSPYAVFLYVFSYRNE
jgi:hypothetical protein